MVISCTNGPTPYYASGCALLLAYDANKDGIISQSEAQKAVDDYNNGLITTEESTFVLNTYLFSNGIINDVCPGCFILPSSTVTITSNRTTVPKGETEYISLSCKDASGNAIACTSIIWYSSNSTVGYVTGNIFYAIDIGTTNIYCTSEGVQSNTIPMTVSLADGYISCNTNPTGAEIWLDGSNTGKLTNNIVTTSAGNHTITFKKSGYQDCVKSATVEAGGTTTVTCDLTTTCTPPTCSMFII